MTIWPPFLLHLYRTGESGRQRDLLHWSGNGGAVHCQLLRCFVAIPLNLDVMQVNDVSQNLTNSLQLRVRKSYLILGVVCAIEFAVFGTGSVLAAALNSDGSIPHPIPMAVFFGIFWGAWFALSLYIIAASCREKLTVTSQTITQEGVFRDRATEVSGITSVKWRAWPVGGSIVIRYPHSRIKIHFDNFLENEREHLIRTLRGLIPEDCQDNWDVFVSSRHTAPTHPPKTRSAAILCMALFIVSAAVSLYGWHIQLGLRFFVVGVGCAIVGLGYLIRILKFIPDSESEVTA